MRGGQREDEREDARTTNRRQRQGQRQGQKQRSPDIWSHRETKRVMHPGRQGII